jgi:elongation factor Ts
MSNPIPAELVQKLRATSGAGLMDCKRALEKTEGNVEKALQVLRENGIAKGSARADKTAAEGIVYSYIHPGSKVGVLLELNCETDFVARTEDFINLAKELSLQVAGANPQWVKREDVPAEIVEREKEIARRQTEGSQKPPQVVEKIMSGRLEEFFETHCLLDQMHLRNPSGKTRVKTLVEQTGGKLNEKVEVRRFTRYRVGGN